MAAYTFCCLSCGEFTEWHQSMKGDKQKSVCPHCHSCADRVFKPVQTFKMDSRLKQRIERGMEPRIVKREDMPVSPSRKRQPRPWQAGH